MSVSFLAPGSTRSRPVIAAVVVATIVAVAGAIPRSGAPRSSGISTMRPVAAGWRFSHAERCYMRKINAKRAARGLSRLRRDPQLGYTARRHAGKMAEARSIWHDGNLTETILGWRALAQNTGTGGACKNLFKVFWNSSAHRDNMLDSWRFFGVGVKWNDGRSYVQQVFEKSKNPDNIWHKP